MNYTLLAIAEIGGGQLIHIEHCQQQIQHIVIDSRKIISEELALFVALKGKRNSGIYSVEEAYHLGIRNFLINEDEKHLINFNAFKDAGFLVCTNTLETLQLLAIAHRQQFTFPVIGITGSNGKTIVKEWLFHLLHKQFKIVKSPKSFNSQIGVPLSVLQMQATDEMGIFEAGISEPDEMERLEKIIQPAFGIFTYLGEAHQSGFKNKTEKIIEKFKLFEQCQSVIVGVDQEEIQAYINDKPIQSKCITWSKANHKANFQFRVSKQNNFCLIEEIHQQLKIQIPFTDEASIYNGCSCFASILVLAKNKQWNLENILTRFHDLPALDMRLQLIEGSRQCLVINDSYSADLDSFKIALDFLVQHQGKLQSICIVSDFIDSGKSESYLNQEIASLLAQKQINQLIGVGENISKYKNLFPKNALFFATTQDLLAYLKNNLFQQSIILLKGARAFEFEKVNQLLAKQIHQTAFEINLNALLHNLNTYRNLLQPGVKTMGMVKAFSYGTGSVEIARTLAVNKIDYLTVAYADEAVVLRNAGIKTPIMVMNIEPSSFDTIFNYQLEPEIYQFELLQDLIQYANGEEFAIHLEIDTGMKRLGFDANQIENLLNIIHENANIKVKSVFTHLAASDEPEHDSFTQHQIEQFEKIANQISAALNYPILKHCLNSSGITRFPKAQFDMVRLGIGLYGIDPSDQVQERLQVIGKLKTIISQIRTLEAGESVGYGRKGKVNKPTKIAIVAIGYADGLNRLLSNGTGYMCIHGQKAKIIGNICMDMTMLDISAIECKVGDEVIVIGQSPSIQEIAKQVNSIPYEILTGISQRVKRVYFFE
jgi:alanine racemase